MVRIVSAAPRKPSMIDAQARISSKMTGNIAP
jgi:hypothetical protein